MKRAGIYAAIAFGLGFWSLTQLPLPSSFLAAAQKAPAANRVPQPQEIGSWLTIPHLEALQGPDVYGEQAGEPVVLTIDVSLQRHLKQRLAEGKVLHGATVLLEIPSGHIVAAAGHSEQHPPGDSSAFKSFAPAASIFKIITASALLRAGVSRNQRVCYHGGKSRLHPSQLQDSRRDRRCTTLFETVPRSQNVAIAKLAVRHLGRDKLLAEASILGFNQPLLTTWTTQMSTVTLPVDDDFEVARTAAGFDGIKLSPLHAAVIAATIANGGVWVQPELLLAPKMSALATSRVITRKDAEVLTQMMTATTTAGTAWRHFSRRDTALTGVLVAGKTGSLTDYTTQIHTSWFVGFAPADNPQVAVAVAILNDMDIWHIQAVETARMALEAYFATRQAQNTEAPAIASSL